MALGFAAVHQLLVSFLHRVDRLPGPQRQALGVAFGLVCGPPADLLMVGLAVLMLAARDADWADADADDAISFAEWAAIWSWFQILGVLWIGWADQAAGPLGCVCAHS